jgi:signal transduction histidine kinase
MDVGNLEPSTILIVDDNPTNLEVLSAAMADSGWEILVALDGESAIEQAEYARPDLIVLDVMMPGINGFETCTRIKARSELHDIPIIFMTALSETTDKVKGLSLGAVDYITKPFQPEEVLARISSHLKIGHLTRKLQEQNQQLQEEIQIRQVVEQKLYRLNQDLESRVIERTIELSQSEAELRQKTKQLEDSLAHLKQTQAQLVQTEKISSLGQLVAGIAHEVNNPVGFVSGNIEHISQYVQDLLTLIDLYQQEYPEPSDEIQDELETIDLDFIKEDLPNILNSMNLGMERIKGIMSSLRTFTRADKGEKQPADINEGLESTLMILQHRLKANKARPAIELVKSYGELPLVRCYGGQLNQVFMNLIANAIDVLDEASQNRTFAELEANPNIIRIQTEQVGDRAIVRISDNGLGMSQSVQQEIFDAFYTTKPVGKGTGLGLSISRQIIEEKHGGKLTCISTPGQGTEFAIEIQI